jgi:hypothetical protein
MHLHGHPVAQQRWPIECEEGADAAKGKGRHQTDRKGKPQGDEIGIAWPR